MKFDTRVVFAASALILGSCQGAGFDSGGMGGEMTPPMSQPGSMSGGLGGNGNGGLSGGLGNQIAGPNVGANGQEELANPGATLAPNEAQYAVTQGPTGMKCPVVQEFNQQYGCTLTFNLPTPSPSPSPGSTPAPTPSPTPTPTPKPSASSDDSDDDSDATPTPSPGAMITMQVEPLPRDLPNATNPNPAWMHITPLVAIRLQSNSQFTLQGGTSVQYTLPAMQYTGRVFGLQLYYETTIRGKRLDQYIPGSYYQNYTTPLANTVQFSFNIPRAVTVRSSQVWLLAMYGAQVPPGTTPTPSPTPSTSASPSSSP
jgi:hypothetical protein